MNYPRLHPDTIEQVKQQVDIVEVISEHVVLRQKGRNLIGLCPFHQEKTPSFTVNPSRQMYYCFGCQAGGNVITFLKEINKDSLEEVILDLAKRYSIPIQTIKPEQRQEILRQITIKDQLYEVLAASANFYQHTLYYPTFESKKSLDYLYHSRNMSDDLIKNWGIGYAPPSWNTLYKYLVEQKGWGIGLVEQAGLIVPKQDGNGYYDRFRDRIIIPIRDTNGKIIAFGGRTLSDEQPKYLNSPESPIFQKRNTLFGLDRAKGAITKQDQAVVVEGYFDVISLCAHQITNVVASLGTALSVEQVKKLIRYTTSKQIVLNFDSDPAGKIATEKAIQSIGILAYQGEVQVKILTLPEGKDADNFIHQKGAIAYQELLTNSPLWIDWQIQQLIADKDLNKADQYQKVAEEMVKILQNITNPNTQNYYIQVMAQHLCQNQTKLVPRIIEELISRLPRAERLYLTKKKPLKTNQSNLLENAESILLRIYLHSKSDRPAIIQELENHQLEFSLTHHRTLWSLILSLPDQGINLTEQDLISQLQHNLSTLERDAIFNQISALFQLPENIEKGQLVRTPLIIKAAIACLQRIALEKYRNSCLEKWNKLTNSSDSETWEFYSQEFYQADRQIKELDQLRQMNHLILTDFI